jgi:hypothetical protein
MVVVGTASGAAAAADPPEVDTTAEVGGAGGTTPVIECGWALNDVDHNWAADPTLQDYGQDDDSPDGPDAPSGNTDAAPCVASGVAAAQANDWTDVIGVKPNAHDDPTQAYVELWAAVSSNSPANTIIRWDVYHPDESFKVQVDGTRYTTDSTKCVGPTGMFTAAVATGQVTTTAKDNIVAECEQQHKNLWYGAFPISKHQPYGSYKIVLTASLAGGGSTTLTYYISVLSFYQLEKDFTSIDFGSVASNNHYWQVTPGDFTFGSGGPTVRNTGNAGIGLDNSFDPLCKQGVPACTDVKRIDKFDAHFGARTGTNLQYIGTNPDGSPNVALGLDGNVHPTGVVTPNAPDLAAPIWHSFDNDLKRTLCPNDVGKYEASIYVELVENGSYAGELFLRGRPNPICPTDLGAPYNAAPTVPAVGYWP